MERRELLGLVGAAGFGASAGCTAPFGSGGTRLAAVHGRNRTNEDCTVEVTVDLDGEQVAEGTLDLARHRTGSDTPFDELACTWPTDRRGTFTVEAYLVERDQTHRRSTDEDPASDVGCYDARISAEEDGIWVDFWICDSRDSPSPGYNCDADVFDWE